MQSVILPQSDFFSTQFGHHGFDPSPERLSLNPSRSTNDRGCSPRALQLPRSMSSSNPARDTSDTAGDSRRPGHPELPQPVPTTTAASFGPVLTSGPPSSESREPTLQRVVSASTSELSQRPFAVSDTLPRLPPVFGEQTASQHVDPTFGPATLATSPPGTTRTVGQKPTRRTKAHVASACVNCKKKHLGCDSARPCRRCVLAGKSATCVDVTHKKRGRPPLKAEEGSIRQYTTQMENPASIEPSQPPQRRANMHRATSSRELRPITDLQLSGGPGGIGMAPNTQPQRWPTSLFSPNVDPMLSMPPGFGPRRFSIPGSPQQLMPGFSPIAAGFNPGLNTGRVPLPYTSPPMSLVTSPPQYHQNFGPPVSPYRDSIARPPTGEPSPRDTRQTNYPGSPVRLPPILPATGPPGPPPGHRLSDPYPTLWTLRGREELLPETRPRLPSQGQIEPLSRVQLHPPISTVRHNGPPPIQSAPAPPATTAQSHSVQTSSTRPREDEANAEAEREARPAKRRKMALHDMVND